MSKFLRVLFPLLAVLALVACSQPTPPPPAEKPTEVAAKPTEVVAAKPTEAAAEPTAVEVKPTEAEAKPTEAAAAKEPVVVRIGTQPWLGYGPWWIAAEKKFDEKYGIKLEMIDFVQDQDVNAGLASSQLEGANLATHTAIKNFSAGVDIRIVMIEDTSTTADAILAGADIKTIADLKDKQVAYEEATTSDLLLNYALLQNNMTLKDIKPVPMPAADAGSAIIAKKVDASVTYEPYISEAMKKDKDIHLLYTAAERPGLISDTLALRADFIEKNPEAVKALFKVWDEAVQYYKTDTKDAQAIIADKVGSKPEDLVTAFEGVQFFGMAENQAMMQGDYQKTLTDVAEVGKSIGLFEEAPDLVKLVDTSLWK